jgi:hypothetical protein
MGREDLTVLPADQDADQDGADQDRERLATRLSYALLGLRASAFPSRCRRGLRRPIAAGRSALGLSLGWLAAEADGR